MNPFQDATLLIGRTPMVRIRRLYAPGKAQVLAKLEFLNPAGSIKDRVALAIIDTAEAAGELTSGATIVEATSGNTGIALAMVGAVRGYKVILTMPDTMSQERRMLLEAFGAELVLTPGSQGMAGAVSRAEQIATETGGLLARQFANPANPLIHQTTTAQEIWTDTAGQVDYVVAGIGTGGTITGIGRALKQLKPKVQIIGVEPAESPLLSQGTAGSHGIQGIGANFVPSILDRSVIDQVVTVPTETAMQWARCAGIQEGLMVGISAGAGLAATEPITRRHQAESKTIVVIVPDGGDRYLSSSLYIGRQS